MISAKYTSLLLLILQNASVSMLTRLSRTPSTSTSSSHSILYNPSAAVFVAEIIKFIVSLSMLVRDERRSRAREKEGKNVVLLAKNAVMDLITNQRREVFKLTIPAALYAAQNTLLVRPVSLMPFVAFGLTPFSTKKTVYRPVQPRRCDVSNDVPTQTPHCRSLLRHLLPTSSLLT